MLPARAECFSSTGYCQAVLTGVSRPNRAPPAMASGRRQRRGGKELVLRTEHHRQAALRGYPDAPRVAVGAVVFCANRVLLVRRGRPPADGQWAIPGGAVELGETLAQAAEREIREETGIRIEAQAPIYVFDMVERDPSGRVRFHYVIVDLAARFIGGELRAGDDAAEARWVSADEMQDLQVSPPTRQLLARQYAFG